MLWNCPHCQNSLSIADEKIGTAWAFSQCCDCRGFSMVRKPEVNVVKVDRAPEGERVIATDPGEPPLLSREANQRLAQYIQGGGKPEVRAVSPRRPALPSAPAPQAALPRLPEVPAVLRRKEAPLPLPMEAAPAEALPEPPADTEAVSALFGYAIAPAQSTPVIYARPKLLPIAMGIAGAMTIGSGIYLYLQSQAIWEKTQLTTPASGRSSVKLSVRATEQGSVATRRIPGETDQLPTSAAAPQYAMPAAAAPAPAPQVRPAPSSVRTKENNVRLRSGPGSGYPIVAIVDQNAQFAIADWSEHWFKVVLPEPKDRAVTGSSLPKAAWVQAESVQVLSSVQ